MQTLFKQYLFIFFSLLALTTQISAAELAHDDFNNNSASGYSRDDGWTNQLKIKGKESSYKTYSFGSSYADQSLTITFKIKWQGDWDTNYPKDYFIVKANDIQKVKENLSGTSDSSWTDYTITSNADSNGKLKLEFFADSNNPNELVVVDDVIISGLPYGGEAASICYGDTVESGDKTTTAINSLENNLQNVTVYFDTSSLFDFFDPGFTDCSVDDGAKSNNCEEHENGMNLGPLSIFNSGGWTFNLGNTSKDENRSISTYQNNSFFSKIANMFSSKSALMSTYEKDGKLYRSVMKACQENTSPDNPEDETIPNETDNRPTTACDTFADGLQTRGDNSTVDFSGGSAKLYNNPDAALNTYNTPVNAGGGNDLTCIDNINGDTDQSCQPNNSGAAVIDPITILYPATFSFPDNDTSGGDSITVGKTAWTDEFNSGDELDAYIYNSVSAHGGVSPNHLNFKITNQLKLGTLQAANGNEITFTSKTSNEFEIIATTINTNPSNTFTADTLVKNIKIKTANFGDTNTVNITAKQTIKIDSFSSKHTSTYNLTAPYVNINTLNDVSGSGQENTISIKADYVDIGTLNIGDATTLTITPLTPDKDVLVKINSLSTGSNNILNFAKGTYYIKTLDTSGSGSGYQWNMNGKVNLILEDDWNSDSAIAINADHSGASDLSTDSHSASDLFIYSKGNITTTNNTRIVGTIYSEKEITLNSASYIKGALSAQNLITLGNATQVYYDQTISDEGMGECTSNPDTPDLEQCGIFPNALATYQTLGMTDNPGGGSANIVLNTPSVTANATNPTDLTTSQITCDSNDCSINPPPNVTFTFPPFVTGGTDLSITSDTIFSPDETFQDSSVGYKTIGNLDVNANGVTLTFNSGYYYIDSLTVNGNNFSLNTNTTPGNPVILIIKNNLTINSNTIEFDAAKRTSGAGDLLIFTGGDFDTSQNSQAQYDIVAYIYTKGEFKLSAGSNSGNGFKGAITSEQDLYINKNQTFEYDGVGLDENGFGECSVPIGYTTGPFDAWDTSRDNNATPPLDKNISTKIVNEAFQLSLASLNKASDGYEVKAGAGSSIDVAIYPKNSTVAISNHITYDANTNAHIPSSANLTVTSAQKDAVVGFKLCTTYENNASLNETIYILYPSNECSALTTLNACDATTTGSPTWHVCHSTDNFAIRPYSLRVFGENQYKRAGENFTMAIKAVDQANFTKASGLASSVQGTPNFNVSTNTLNFSSNFYTPSSADIGQMQTDTGVTNVTTCPNNGTFSVVDNNFSNGDVNVSMNFNETGILDINASEKLGSEFALVDADDTPDSQRLIQSTTTIYDTTDISKTNLLLFVPYSLVTTADYNTTTAKSWLYMNDINGSTTTPAMSSYITYTITAQNKNGATTQNYTKTCFPDTANTAPTINGLKLNTTFDLFLDADINSSSNVNLSLYTEDNNSIAIWTMNTNKVIVKGNNNLQEWISPLNFTNGVGQAKVHFNIDRNNSVSLNPVAIKVIDVNTSTSWMSNPGSPKNFTGATLNKSFNYIYGRTNAPRQRFVSNSGTAFIYYQAYCSGTDVNNNTCDKSLLPDGRVSLNINDPRWFNTTQHSSPTDGEAASVNQRGYAVGTGSVTGTPTVSNPAQPTLTYVDAATKGYPYKTTMENNASSWLIYNKYNAAATTNEFEVEFTDNNSSWAGQRETNTTTNRSASDITNRRSMW